MAESSQIFIDFFRALQLANIPLPTRIDFDGDYSYERIASAFMDFNHSTVVNQSRETDGIVFKLQGVEVVCRPEIHPI